MAPFRLAGDVSKSLPPSDKLSQTGREAKQCGYGALVLHLSHV